MGIGQSEIEITQLADATALVLQPLAGDHVQFLKAGVMEVPDVFVVNKCDEERLARRSVYELETALRSVRAGTRHDGVPLRVFRTSALRGTGIAELAAFLATHVPPPDAATLRRRERHFLAKAIAERYGRFGVEELERAIAALPPAVAERAVYEDLEDVGLAAIRARIR